MASLNDIASNIAEVLSYNPAEPLLFSSGTFWALFLVFLPLYSLLRKRWTLMAVFVLAFSFYFYYRCSGVFVLLLAGTSLVDWLLSRLIARPGSGPTLRRTALVVSLLCSLGILAYFKYANFFLWNINATVGSNFQPLDLILPVGISFYTFQSVSYIVDVYKGRVAPTRTWLEYAFFLAFFPALVAGPIVRADYFLPQIRRNTTATREETFTGFWLIILGVVKKAVIADYIAQYNDLIFQTPGGYNGFETLMGIAGYTMQIYCDFSGYSDMAIGIALIMGFKLAKNFNFPYKSRNLTDFWHRWHISLSTWLRDYIYIPLGGHAHRRTLAWSGLEIRVLGRDARCRTGCPQGRPSVAWQARGLLACESLVLDCDNGSCGRTMGVLPRRFLERLLDRSWLVGRRLFSGENSRIRLGTYAVAHTHGHNHRSALPANCILGQSCRLVRAYPLAGEAVDTHIGCAACT